MAQGIAGFDGSGSGESCERSERPAPLMTGMLAAGGECSACEPEPPDHPEPTTVNWQSGPMVLTDNSASGSPPLTFTYRVDLTSVPPDAIIVAAEASYGSSVPLTSASDMGGSSTTGTIRWSAAGIHALNAAIGADGRRSSAFPVTATLAWNTPPPTSFGACNSFAVAWVLPYYP